jgi:hypothetical protein
MLLISQKGYTPYLLAARSNYSEIVALLQPFEIAEPFETDLIADPDE